MKTHHTKNKGDIGLTKIVADLTEQGYYVSLPISEHLPYDLIFDDGKKLRRVQVKYRIDGVITNRTSFSTKKGLVIKTYKDDDFDLYAMYLPKVNRCIYIPKFENNKKGITIRTDLPKSNLPFHWWEDFISADNEVTPKMKVKKDLHASVV